VNLCLDTSSCLLTPWSKVLEKQISLIWSRNSVPFMEHASLTPCSQERMTECTFKSFQPHKSHPYSHSIFFEMGFAVIEIKARMRKWAGYLA
jgi:hypothetical protein